MDHVITRIRPILDAIKAAGGRPLIVGGAVRDALLGIEPTDADVEVYDLDIDSLIRALESIGKVNVVGKSFGVFKVSLPGVGEIDVSMPRTENKIGKGHRAFAIEFGTLSPEQAAARRDFTMNAMAFDPFTNHLIDPYGGEADVRARILRHTSPAFAEDPLRVLRGMQFAARFGLVMASETAQLCRSLLPEAETLAIERVWEEWRKWAEKGSQPALGLRVLVDTGWIALYPELVALMTCPQDVHWHPEGDVFEHTLAVCVAAATIAQRERLRGEERLILLLAALCHDLGKPATTIQGDDGHLRSPGHAEAGIPPTTSLLARIGCRRDVAAVVVPLVREHLAHISMPLDMRPVRRLSLRLSPATITQWGRLVEADHSGRSPLLPGNPAAPMVALAEYLAVDSGKPQPLLLGRHLLERGMRPGPEMGHVLKAAYEAQIAGEFETLEGALAWATPRLT